MYYACVVYTGELEMTEAMEIALARYPAVGNLVIPKTALNMACSREAALPPWLSACMCVVS